MRQETLEEAAESLFPDSSIQKRIFIKGARWQQEQDKLKHISQLEEIVSRLEEDGLYALQGIKDNIESLKKNS
jgi:hypothetical protein